MIPGTIVKSIIMIGMRSEKTTKIEAKGSVSFFCSLNTNG